MSDREYATDEEGFKRYGYVADESDADVAKTLPVKEEGKEEEKEQDADLALEGLKISHSEDPDNGADFDVVADADATPDRDSA